MKIKNILASVSLLIVTAGAAAAPLEINATTTSIQHFFSSCCGYENLLGSYYGGDPVPAVAGRFVDYDKLQITLSAPVGFQYTTVPETGANPLSIIVNFFYNYAYSPGMPFFVLPTTVKFTNYTGPAFNSSVETRVFDGGHQFYTEGWITWPTIDHTNSFSFTSIVISADLSSVTDKSSDLINYVPSFGSSVGMLTNMPNGVTTDPGPMLRLESVSAVPEPSTMLLTLLGVVVIATTRKKI